MAGAATSIVGRLNDAIGVTAAGLLAVAARATR